MKRKLFFTLILLGVSFYSISQYNAVENTYFPDEDIPKVTPGLKKNKGFTKYKDLILFLNDLKKERPNLVNIKYIGTSEKGDSIPMIFFNDKNNESKIKVFFQAGLHGNEPASTEGILYFLYQLIKEKKYDKYLNDFSLAVIPMANIDGYNQMKRLNKKQLDLNRDQTMFAGHESKYLKKAFIHFNPDMAVDFHEFNPYRSEYVNMNDLGITTAYDALFLPSGNLNIQPDIRELIQTTLVEEGMKSLKESGRNVNIYAAPKKYKGVHYYNYGSNSERSSSTNYGLSNCVSILMEIRGVNLYKTSFQRRVNTTSILANTYLKSAIKNKKLIKSTIKKANHETVNKNYKVIIKSTKEFDSINYQFIDLATKKIVSKNLYIANNLKQISLLSRQIPVAYILLPSEKEAVERLEYLGVKVSKISKEYEVNVQSYFIKELVVSSQEIQKVFPVSIKTEIVNEAVIIPSGSFIVYNNQENSRYAGITLEPESPNSFCHFKVIDVLEKQKLPYYRLVDNIELK